MAGIIPARAGFTIIAQYQEENNRDHPRSRGVYDAARAWTSRREGSSPLARGLRCTGEHVRGLLRIIPARAGFTSPGTGAIPKSRDHPRSRGVYGGTVTVEVTVYGSSPLARGLLSSSLRLVGWLVDHPRSRGVYHSPKLHYFWDDGSSPLARGLHVPVCESIRFRRIIPARAGFTPP